MDGLAKGSFVDPGRPGAEKMQAAVMARNAGDNALRPAGHRAPAFLTDRRGDQPETSTTPGAERKFARFPADLAERGEQQISDSPQQRHARHASRSVRGAHSPNQVIPETSAIYVARSTNGGKAFSRATRVAFFRDYRQTGRRTPPVFRTFALTWLAADGTPASHRVFLAYQERDPENLAKGAEVAVWCTPDQGSNWTKLPRPQANVDGHQIMPALDASGGKLSVVWYDSRSEPAFTSSGPVSGSGSGGAGLGMDVYYNQRASTSCAGAWVGELKLTSQSFNPNLFGSIRAITPFIGDYIAVAADATHAFVVWADNRDIDGAGNAAEDDDPDTNPTGLINARSRDSNIYFQKVTKK